MGSCAAIRFSGLDSVFRDDFDVLLEASRIADDVGIGQIVLPDHLVMGARTDDYPFGEFPFGSDEPWLEPIAALASIAAITHSVRLATGILIAPLRPVPLLAKSVATVDVISKGRLDLGVGTGWHRAEYEASGVPFGDRHRRLDDLVGACRALWSEAPASYSSPTVTFTDMWCRPAPVQAGGPALWFGGNATPSTARRVARSGTGWLPIGGTPLEGIELGIGLLRKEFSAVGRPVEEIRVGADVLPVYDAAGRPDLDSSLRIVPLLAELGVTNVTFPCGAYVRDRSELRGFVERAARVEL